MSEKKLGRYGTAIKQYEKLRHPPLQSLKMPLGPLPPFFFRVGVRNIPRSVDRPIFPKGRARLIKNVSDWYPKKAAGPKNRDRAAMKLPGLFSLLGIQRPHLWGDFAEAAEKNNGSPRENAGADLREDPGGMRALKREKLISAGAGGP